MGLQISFFFSFEIIKTHPNPVDPSDLVVLNGKSPGTFNIFLHNLKLSFS
ncbi:hypothetical protein LguiA_024473 [Lonicera macranthoides]